MHRRLSRTKRIAQLRAAHSRRARTAKPVPRVLIGLLAFSVLVVTAGSAAVVAGISIYNNYADDLVPPEVVYVNRPSAGAKIFDRNGVLLYEFVDDKDGIRIPVPLEQIAPVFIAATIATEDSSFFSNPGVNPRGLARAGWENFSPFASGNGILKGTGGSSITQQLAKNLFIESEERMKRSIDRKAREIVYALEMTREYPKEQILEWYVNQISYGGLYNGVEAASRGYFGKPASELTLAEAALLAGIPQSPAAYEPRDNPEIALVRRNSILDLMLRHGTIQIGEHTFFEVDPVAVEAAKQEPVQVLERNFLVEAPHFVFNQVQPQLEALFGKESVARGGLIVTTSLDLALQNQARAILERWISNVENFSRSRNGAMTIIDPRTGEILVYIGSRDYWRDDIDGNVDNLTALNSPGSSFKPFVYLTGFLKHGWSPATLLDDRPTSYRESDGTVFTPVNPVPGSYQGQITIRGALGNSLNVPAFNAALAIGVPDIVAMARQMGFTSLTGQYGPAISIGGVDLRALDLAVGYAVLANGGIMSGQNAIAPSGRDQRDIQPVTILRVEDGKGNVLFDVDQHRAHRRVAPAEHVYLITDILSDPRAQCMTFGCGGLSVPGHRVAVKTGTSSPFDPNGPYRGMIGETWAFGYTPDVVVGVWAGNSNNAPIVNIYSTTIAFQSMRDAMLAYYNGRPSTPFRQPPGVVESATCTARNAPCAGTDLIVQAVYSTRLDAAAEGGQASLQGTPGPEGTPTAEPTPSDPETTATQAPRRQAAQAVSITSPSGGSVSGAVQITGSASSPNMRFYRLEFGAGASPSAWSSIGQWSTPVLGGSLGTWVTHGLTPGTYTIRLVVQDAVQGPIVSTVTVTLR